MDIKEIQIYKINLMNLDIDKDEVNDGDEINRYFMDLLNLDSDGDGFFDG